MSSHRLPFTAVLSGLVLAAALALPSSALAAPCAGDLKVVNIPVTGLDCIDLGNGEIEIDNPRLLTAQAVEIRGKMILSVDRNLLRQKTLLVPLVAAVKDAGGTYQPVLAGQLQVGNFQLCDLFSSLSLQSPVGASTSFLIDDETPATNDRLLIQTGQINCHTGAAINVSQPALQLAAKLFKLGLAIDQVFATDNAQVALPSTFGLDEARGGRLFGSVSARVPLADEAHEARLALSLEVSHDSGLRPVSLGGAYVGAVPLLPGVVLRDPAVLIDPANQTFGGHLRLSLPPKLRTTGASVLIQDGKLKSVGFDVGLPVPLPVGPIKFQSFGATFTRATTTTTTTTKTVLGTSTQSPATLEGRTSFTAGPSISLPAGTFSTLVGDVNLTIQGPTLQIVGTLTGINKLITLGQATVLVAANPFRFEAGAQLAFPSTTNAVVLGSIFAGATSSAFTGLGTFRIQIPSSIPFIGGQTLAGFSGIVSNKAVGGTILVDPPLLQPRNIGAAFKFGGGFDIIDSITPFITVAPTSTLTASSAAGSARRRANFRITKARKEVAIEVRGRSAKPTGVSITGPRGRKVKTVTIAGVKGKTLVLGVAKLAKGRYAVTGRGIAKVVVETVDPPPFLDPAAGFGTREKPPVLAGTPVEVCWDIKHAPKRAVVDLFEDTNGFAATGRDIALGLPAKACHKIPTADWEPGRHWAYGIIRVGDVPLSARYWPIGITIVHPTRLPAPTGLTATPAHDGAHLTWSHVEGSTGYVVTAVPVNPQDAPAHRAIVLDDAAPATDITLRGAATWIVSVQAVGGQAELGNVSAAIQTGAVDPVVLAGRPNGTPQVGERWAFKLQTRNLATLKILSAPPGTKLDAAAGLLTWTPSVKAGTVEPKKLELEGCSADARCFSQSWDLSAYARGLAPAGPARSFRVLDSVIKGGQTIELRAQGVDEAVTAKVDGKTVKAKVRDEQTVAIALPRTLAKGSHDVSLRIGQGLEETLSGAIVVL